MKNGNWQLTPLSLLRLKLQITLDFRLYFISFPIFFLSLRRTHFSHTQTRLSILYFHILFGRILSAQILQLL